MDHDETPELVEARMLATRASLTDKVAALEQQVMGTLHNATSAVNETVDSVRSVISSAPTTVKDVVHDSLDAVKQSLDIREKVRENPWVAVGSAAAVGFLAGLVVFRDRRPATMAAAYHPAASAPAQPQSPREPGLFDELFARVTGELRKVAEEAIRTASESLRSTVSENVPKFVEKIADRVTGDTTPAHREPQRVMY